MVNLWKWEEFNMMEDEKYKFNICVENAPINPLERYTIKKILNEQGIGIAFLEYRGIMNSAFDSIPIFLNPEIISLLVSSMMTSAMYDSLKTALFILISKISSRLRRRKKQDSGAAFRFKVGNADIFADIPSGLNDIQFKAYMDMVRDTSTTIYKMQENTETEYTNLFLVYDSEKESIDVKTVSEYAKMQRNKKGE